ncbi:MAG: hypothetical protein KAU60_04265, partial [Desulfobacterales bacterium]|nr:hypothetical protein [Desulfobacterales bacterium]
LHQPRKDRRGIPLLAMTWEMIFYETINLRGLIFLIPLLVPAHPVVYILAGKKRHRFCGCAVRPDNDLLYGFYDICLLRDNKLYVHQVVVVKSGTN